MRRDELVVNGFYHIVQRGARQMNIVHNDADRWDFNKLLYYLNDSFIKRQWERDLLHGDHHIFERPESWPERDPLVSICAYCLHDNHFHLLVKEIREGGLSLFMQRLPNSMSRRYNKKYGGSGTIFDGSYKARRVYHDNDLIGVSLYIMVKNVMEKMPGGLTHAMNDPEGAWKYALQDRFSSFPDYAAARNSPIVEKDLLRELFPTTDAFKQNAANYLADYTQKQKHLGELALE